jgi:hypothetical protein
MREALKLCATELREAAFEVDEAMQNCMISLAGTEKGKRRVAAYQQQLAMIAAALAAADAAMAQPEPEAVARVHIHRTCGNAGIAWAAKPLPHGPQAITEE